MNELKKMEIESNKIVDKAKLLVILSQEDYEYSSIVLGGIKVLQKSISETFSPIVKKAHEAHKEAKKQENKHLDPLLVAEQIIKQKSLNYIQDQRRIQAEQERKSREKAQREEEKRRKVLEEQAKRHEEKGNIEKAEERREMAEEVFIPEEIVQPIFEKSKSQSIRKSYKAEVYDLSKLIKSVANGDVPISLIKVDQVALNKMATAMGFSLKLDGVKVKCIETLAVRAQ